MQKQARFCMSVERRQDLIFGAALLLIWLAVSIPRLNGPIDLRWDAGTYYVLGTALAEGKGYRLLNEPGEIEAVQYPPLLPLIVAAHQRVMGTSNYFEVGSRLRFSYFVLSGLYLLAVYALAREFLAPLYALLVGAITALSFTFLHFSDTLYAELPFALVSTLFLLCHRRSDRTLYAVLTGLLGVAAYMLRIAGLALLMSWVAESLIRRRFREAVIRAAVSAIPVLLWQAHIWRATGSDEYHHPTYAYQRAPYYYSNVTYRENSSLVDPFCPELGRTASRDLAGRVVGNLSAIPLGLGESAWAGHVFGPTLLNELHRKFGVPLPARLAKTQLSRALRLFGRLWPARDGRCCFCRHRPRLVPSALLRAHGRHGRADLAKPVLALPDPPGAAHAGLPGARPACDSSVAGLSGRHVGANRGRAGHDSSPCRDIVGSGQRRDLLATRFATR